MSTRVRSHAKINLGLAIGPPRPDGFHALLTLYQTLAVHDFVTVSARPAPATTITLTSNHPRVPLDARNTVWKMVERTLLAASLTATVDVHLEKHLPIQGGMGAGSANAAAALLGLERELNLHLDAATRLRIAAEVGSDVPLFLLGGASLGTDRGQVVEPVPELTLFGGDSIPCVVALPRLGVSTPAAFRDWDRRFEPASEANLQSEPIGDTIEQLSRTYASVFPQASGLPGNQQAESGASGIFPEPISGQASEPHSQNTPENLQGLPPTRYDEQLHRRPEQQDRSGIEDDLAGNSLLALVRTGIENDFESVVFPQYPSLREIKRYLMGTSGNQDSAVYAALSGSGSALFGLYRSDSAAAAAQQRLQQHGVEAIVTRTVARPLYWSQMFAE